MKYPQLTSRNTPRLRNRWLLGFSAVVLVGTLGVSCGGDEESGGSASAKDVTKTLNGALQAHVEGNLDQAGAAYQKVLELDPNNKFAFYNIGLLAQNGNRAEVAETQYRRVLQLDPQYGPALFNLAIIRTGKGDTTEAVSLYNQAIAANDADAGAHYNLGLLLRKQGDTAAGDREISRAVELNPQLDRSVLDNK
jgi:tetratricopeptide (TPR) repeat protein